MYLFIFFLFLVLIVWAFERFYLRGGSTREYSEPVSPGSVSSFIKPDGPGPEHDEVVKTVKSLTRNVSLGMKGHGLKAARHAIDSISDGRDFVSEFTPVDVDGVPAEWVTAPGADPAKRVLYIHGGGFVMGSPKSHRNITSKFSEITNSAVLAIDYRLMPEFKHADCVEDCQTAYQWILKNGPNGPDEIKQLFIGGDSAGGNLSLSLAAWIRDNQMRAPEALVVMSPLTDITFSGASLRDNETTDIMLRPLLRSLNKIPKFVRSLWVVRTYHLRPANPVASPLLGDLSNLPPTLVQASQAEMLLDDARRYVYKACASGSPAKLQTWSDVVHVWQIFEPELPQATEAWVEIGKFLKEQAVV